MLDEIIAQKDPLVEITDEQWIDLSLAWKQENNKNMKDAFIRTLAAHSGVTEAMLEAAFTILNSVPSSPEEKEALQHLNTAQSKASLRISVFINHPFFKTIDLNILEISRTHWISIIDIFQQQGRENVTNIFFFRYLSLLKKVSYDSLVSLLAIQREHRSSYSHTHPKAIKNLRRTWRNSFFSDDEKETQLISEPSTSPEIDSQLEETGVRITPLVPATPMRGHRSVKRTPGGSKVRRLCSVDGYTLYQSLSPTKSPQHPNGRVKINHAAQHDIEERLPRLLFQRAEVVEYTATLAHIIERSGLSRISSARSIMGASSSEVFQAHGIAIHPKEKHSHHWSHLIAHFLADEKDIISSSPDVLINLVPSTASANYNTLETIELYIRDKLVSKTTNEIHITVTPNYSEENLIPDLLKYDLKWLEMNELEEEHSHHEVFYISPQSYMRISKRMHASIAALRKTTATLFNYSEKPQQEVVSIQEDLFEIEMKL